MPNSIVKLLPDGVIVDQVSELLYERKDRAIELYASSPLGYRDALWKFLQALASGGAIVVRPGKAGAADRLRDQLSLAGRSAPGLDFPPEDHVQQQLFAYQLCKQSWSAVARLIQSRQGYRMYLDFLRREAQLYWVGGDPRWNADHYLKASQALPLDRQLLHRIFTDLRPTKADSAAFELWIRVLTTTHYTNFYRYLTFEGVLDGAEYIPSLTRALPHLLPKAMARDALDDLVLPFVGLAMLKKVRRREDVIPHAIAWLENEGRVVVEGLERLRDAMAASGSPREQERLLRTAGEMLEEPTSLVFRVFLHLVRLTTDVVSRGVPTTTAKAVATEISASRSLRWLWRISHPDLAFEWARRVDRLISE